MLDYHMHTFFSPDGKMTMEEACKKAMSVGLKEIAFTDHMDMNLPENKNAFQIKDMDQYIQSIASVREKYKGKLSVKTGIEIGLQDRTLEAAASLVRSYPFDFVIASLHLVDGLDPYRPEYYKGRDKLKSYTVYYQKIYDLLRQYDDYCVLGHLDYVRRYMPYPYAPEDYKIGMEIIESILKLLVERGKGLELNTAGCKHSSRQPHPHPAILKRYRDLGGEIVTIGSDAHAVNDVGYENRRALEWLKQAGFDYVTFFTDRQPEFVKI